MKVKKIIVRLMLGVLLLTSISIVPAQAAYVEEGEMFTDVKPYTTENYQAVEYLKEEGIVVGYDDGTYGVDKNINRAEFLKIVMEASDYDLGGTNCYSDVTDQWFAQYVCKATDLGLVDGYPDGFFRPEQEINFAEASKIIVNTLGVEITEDQFADWYEKYVYALEDVDAIPGNIDNFADFISRGDMAEMSWRVMTDTTYKVSNTVQNIKSGITVKEFGGELQGFDSCAELADYYEDNSSNNYRYYPDVVMIEEDIAMTDDAVDAAPMDSAGEATMESKAAETGGGGAEEFSTTNIQVEGVDEADILKNDGRYIYYMKGDTVRVIDAYPPEGMEELASISFDDSSFWPNEMYVDDDRMVVIGTSYEAFGPSQWESTTKVYLLDISDKSNIELMREVSYEGYYNTSRKVDDTVYLISNKNNYYVPWEGETWDEADLVPQVRDNGVMSNAVGCSDVRYIPGNYDVADYMIISAMDINNDDSEIEKEVVIGRGDTIYASRDNLYVAEYRYNYNWYYDDDFNGEETYVHKFSLDGRNVGYQGVGTVPGTVLNQFSMDENGEYFRIATTTGWWEGLSNGLYVMNGDMEVVGKVDGLAPGEEIYSVRFMGDRAYMVTFEQIDPLFVIGLEDPKNPKVLGELKIPGVSDYLHPYDENHLIGFGLETASPDVIESLGWSWFQGIKISMFDVTDVENPVELHKVVIGDRGSESELRYNHKALLFDKEKGIMAFPVAVAEIPQNVKDDLELDSWVYGDYVFQGAYVYDVSVEDGFQLRGTISHYEDDQLGDNFEYYYSYDWGKLIDRILYIGDYFYTVSKSMVQANEMDTLDEVQAIELAE